MTEDEKRADRHREFAAQQAATAKKLTARYGAQWLKKYGPAKYFTWQQATKEAGTR